MEIQWKVAVASESILGYKVERGRIALGNMRGMRGEGRGIGAFIGLVPMLAIYVEHLRLPDVSSRDRSNNTRVLRQRNKRTIVFQNETESIPASRRRSRLQEIFYHNDNYKILKQTLDLQFYFLFIIKSVGAFPRTRSLHEYWFSVQLTIFYLYDKS